MNRLTEFHNGICGMSIQAVKDGYDKYSVYSKLAAYEDTGLTPEEIKALKSELEKTVNIGQELATECKRLLTELSYYFNAEEHLHKHFGANITLMDMLNHFVSHVEAADGEPLKGFRILTNVDAESYDRWKLAEEALKGGEGE